jgi:hypothetical protein
MNWTELNYTALYSTVQHRNNYAVAALRPIASESESLSPLRNNTKRIAEDTKMTAVDPKTAP